MPTTVPSHIMIDDKGVARIEGTRFKVIHLIEAWKSGANTPAALHEAYSHLTMAQIHAGLAYYYDHAMEIDAQIDRELKEAMRSWPSSAKRPIVRGCAMLDRGHELKVTIGQCVDGLELICGVYEPGEAANRLFRLPLE